MTISYISYSTYNFICLMLTEGTNDFFQPQKPNVMLTDSSVLDILPYLEEDDANKLEHKHQLSDHLNDNTVIN